MVFFSKRNEWSSFRYLNICQFIGAMNDNTYKLLLVYCYIQLYGAESGNKILPLVGAIYVLPFIMLSTTAGVLADKYSKRSIIVFTRLAELVVMLLGMLSFWLHSEILSFAGLFLLASHSAVFGPCKFGIVPEIAPKDAISQANGILTMLSYVAIIVGTFLASFLADITDRNFVISLGLCSVFSFISFLSALKIQATPPAGSRRKVTPNLLAEMAVNLHVIRREPSLLSAVLGSAFFLFIGSYVQLNMIPFAMNTLHLTDVQGGYMFLLTAFGIGVGSLLAGKVSGKAVEFGLVPIGGISMAICCFLLNTYSDSLSIVLWLVFLVGVFGGMYLVPLDSFIQVASPKRYRGQVVATGNVLGFCGVLLSALSLYVISDVLHLPPNAGFAIVGVITFIIASAITFTMSGYFVRFISLIANYLFFRGNIKGKEAIPLDKPSIFFVPQSYWPWATVLLASQRRRMRLLTLAPQTTSPFPAPLLRRFIPITVIHDIREIAPDGEQADTILRAIERGTSIAIFCSKRTLAEHVHELIANWAQHRKAAHLKFFAVTIPENQENIPSQSAVLEELEVSVQS